MKRQAIPYPATRSACGSPCPAWILPGRGKCGADGSGRQAVAEGTVSAGWRISALRRVMALLALPALQAAAPAQEWTRFRGPDGSGTAAGMVRFPDSFSAADFAWRTPLPGPGVSSPVLWGGRLFLTSETAEAGHRAVLAFEAATGRELWRVTDGFSVYGKHQFNSFASSTPCVDAERVYLCGASGGSMKVMALSHEGKILWRQDLGQYGEEHGSGVSPVLADGVLVVCKDNKGGDSFIAGLKPADGAVVWRHARQSVATPFSTPLTIRRPDGGESVIVAGNPEALTCLNAADGRLLWKVENATRGDRPVGSPVLAGDVCYMSAGQGGTGKACAAVRVTAERPEIIWQNRKGIPYVPTPVGTAGRLYLLGDGGVLTCLNAEDGSEIYNERVFRDKAYSSPVLAGGRLYCTGRSGQVAVVEAGDTFRIVGTGQLDGDCDATPAVAGGRMFFRTRTHLLCLTAAEEGRNQEAEKAAAGTGKKMPETVPDDTGLPQKR